VQLELSNEGRYALRALVYLAWADEQLTADREAGCFHRGISLAVALLVGLILAAEAIRNHAAIEPAVLGAGLAAVMLVAWHVHAAFRATPANFPVPRAASSSRIPPNNVRIGYRKSKGVQR
jgi:hypothetical protein